MISSRPHSRRVGRIWVLVGVLLTGFWIIPLEVRGILLTDSRIIFLKGRGILILLTASHIVPLRLRILLITPHLIPLRYVRRIVAIVPRIASRVITSPRVEGTRVAEVATAIRVGSVLPNLDVRLGGSIGTGVRDGSRGGGGGYGHDVAVVVVSRHSVYGTAGVAIAVHTAWRIGGRWGWWEFSIQVLGSSRFLLFAVEERHCCDLCATSINLSKHRR